MPLPLPYGCLARRLAAARRRLQPARCAARTAQSTHPLRTLAPCIADTPRCCRRSLRSGGRGSAGSARSRQTGPCISCTSCGRCTQRSRPSTAGRGREGQEEGCVAGGTRRGGSSNAGCPGQQQLELINTCQVHGSGRTGVPVEKLCFLLHGKEKKRGHAAPHNSRPRKRCRHGWGAPCRSRLCKQRRSWRHTPRSPRHGTAGREVGGGRGFRCAPSGWRQHIMRTTSLGMPWVLASQPHCRYVAPTPCTSRPAVLQPYFPFSHRLTATAGRQPVPLSAALAASVHAAMLAINRAREAGAGGAVQRKLPPAVVCAGGAAVEPRAAPAVAVRALRGGVRKQAEP